MAIQKTVNQNTLVNDIMTVGGVNKDNATSIFNIFTNAWQSDKIGMLKAVDGGIAIKRKPARPTRKKAPAKKATTATKTVTAKAPAKKKKVAKKATGSVVGKVKTKGKKKLKSKKAKGLLPSKTKSTQTTATA